MNNSIKVNIAKNFNIKGLFDISTDMYIIVNVQEMETKK